MPSETEIPAPLEVRRAAAEIIRTGRYDEEELEDALVLIGGDLWGTRPGDGEEVVGRQVPAGDAGTLDLITLHQRSGELTIYELKAREIQVSDLAQVESYRLALNELEPDDLAWLLVISSGRKGIPRIWDSEDLRGMLDIRNDSVDNEHDWTLDNPVHDPALRRISCAVIGRAWKARVARLANSMGIKLIHTPKLIATALDEIATDETVATREGE